MSMDWLHPWIGLDWVSKLVDWVGLDLEKWTHRHLWFSLVAALKVLRVYGLELLTKTQLPATRHM